MTPDQKMSIDEMQSRLQALGVDVAKDTLKGWAYNHIIAPPERYKHGKGSGKKGRAVSWSERSLREAAAVWAVRNNPRIKKAPPLRLIPAIAWSAEMVFDSPKGIYKLPQGHFKLEELTYKSIKPRFRYDPWFVTGKKIHPTQDEWTELVTTWIAATQKAREGKQIKDAYEVRYYWKSKKYKVLEGDYVVEEGANYDLQKITLKKKKPSSDYDEVVIMIDGGDARRKLVRILTKHLKEP